MSFSDTSTNTNTNMSIISDYAGKTMSVEATASTTATTITTSTSASVTSETKSKLKTKDSLRADLQHHLEMGRRTYAQMHPYTGNAVGVHGKEQAPESVSEEICAFIKWFEGLDPATFRDRNQVKIPIRLGPEAREEIEQAGFYLRYLHSSYGWFLLLSETFESRNV